MKYLLIGIALLFGYPMQHVYAEPTLKVGEMTGYTGIYCQSKTAAAALMSLLKEQGDGTPFQQGGCFAGRGTIKILKKLDSVVAKGTNDTWTLVQVYAGLPTDTFIVTSLPVELAGYGI